MVRPACRAAVFACLVLAGCGPTDDGIKTYRLEVPNHVPKADNAGPGPFHGGGAPGGGAAPLPAATDPNGEYRILGAMFPADDPAWFFKLTTPASRLTPEFEAAFDKMMAGVRFPKGMADGPVYDLPEGWKNAGPRSIHKETIRFGPADAQLEITVTGATGGAKQNIDRWAGQVGAGPPKADDPKSNTREIQANGVKGLRVDVRGPKNPAGGGMAPFAGGGPK